MKLGSVFARRCGVVVAGAAVALLWATSPGRAALPASKKAILTQYLTALRSANYPAAFGLLSKPEQTYFGTSQNFGSVYAADSLKIDSFRILASTTQAATTVAIVSERVEFFDHVHQRTGIVTAKTAYGIVDDHGHLGIKDPYHPWRAIVPRTWSASANGINVVVRKISFFTGRVELLFTFENRGDTTVTLLPYGRSVLRDGSGKPHQPIETKLPGLTDANLYTGVRLAPSGRYSGIMTFFTANRFTPSALSATISPILADGADSPFAIELPAFAIAH